LGDGEEEIAKIDYGKLKAQPKELQVYSRDRNR